MPILLVDPDQNRRDLLQTALAGKGITVIALNSRTEAITTFEHDVKGYQIVLVGPSNVDSMSRTEFANALYKLGDGDKPRVIDYSLATPDDGLVAQAADLHQPA